jgi:tetratricopeptide (TPR) repeat protein
MRILIFSLGLAWFSLTQAAVIVKDSSVYKAGIQLLNGANTESGFLDAAEYFRKAADTDSTFWLARYYAGVSYNMASGENPNSKSKEELIDKAQKELDMALKLSPDEPELIILQAFIFLARIQVNPIGRAINYSPKAVSLLDKALGKDPGNPRAVMLKAYNIYYTPKLLNGGPSNALPVFEEAKKLFSSYVPESDISPQWGAKETINMINLCEKEVSLAGD